MTVPSILVLSKNHENHDNIFKDVVKSSFCPMSHQLNCAYLVQFGKMYILPR